MRAAPRFLCAKTPLSAGPDLGGAMGAAAPGPAYLGIRNFGKCNFLCAICEIYCAAVL